MTDDQLREAAARALGWTPAGLGQWYVPVTEPKGVVLRHQAPPLDWITAGELLELCARCDDVAVSLCTSDNEIIAYRETRPRQENRYYQPVTARHVIEACVMALDTQPTTP